MKKYDCSIIWIAFCLPWFIVKSIDKAYDKQKETLDKRQRIIENLTNMVFSATNEYERQECLIQVEIYKRKIAENYLDLCKKKIDTKTFLERLHEYETYVEIWKSLSEKR